MIFKYSNNLSVILQTSHFIPSTHTQIQSIPNDTKPNIKSKNGKKPPPHTNQVSRKQKNNPTNISKHSLTRHHCLDRRVISASQMKWLIEINVEIQLEREEREHPSVPWLINIDWDDIATRFNARFGKSHMTKAQLLCAVNASDDFWKPFIMAYADADRGGRKREA